MIHTHIFISTFLLKDTQKSRSLCVFGVIFILFSYVTLRLVTELGSQIFFKFVNDYTPHYSWRGNSSDSCSCLCELLLFGREHFLLLPESQEKDLPKSTFLSLVWFLPYGKKNPSFPTRYIAFNKFPLFLFFFFLLSCLLFLSVKL